ncbi:BA75_01313T0 [Komagataella pastoris]|uniref:BA75_01313T0 n=1 Tax=Komagataella pastoris TaxID=4922 RepID=A0A1B2J7Y1_PICPA|nr:BA75_01313T0 [Komagataella pastoris]
MSTIHYPVPSRPVEILQPEQRPEGEFSGITVDNRSRLNEENYYQEKIAEALKRGSERRYIDDHSKGHDSPSSDLEETPDQFFEFHIHDNGDRKISRPETASSVISENGMDYDDLFVDRKQPKHATSHVKQFIRKNVFQKKTRLPNIGVRELELQKRLALLEGPIDDDEIISAMPMVACSSDYYDQHTDSTPNKTLQSSSTSNPSSPSIRKEEEAIKTVREDKPDALSDGEAYGIGSLVADAAFKFLQYILPSDSNSNSNSTTISTVNKALPPAPTFISPGLSLDSSRPSSKSPCTRTTPLYSYMAPKASSKNQTVILKAFKRPFSKKSSSSASLKRENHTELVPSTGPLWSGDKKHGLEFISKAPRSKAEDFYNFVRNTNKKKSRKKNGFLSNDSSQEALSFNYNYNMNSQGVTFDASFERASETEVESYSYSSTRKAEEPNQTEPKPRFRIPSFKKSRSTITADQSTRERDNPSLKESTADASYFQAPIPVSSDPKILSNIHMIIGSIPYFRIVFRPLTLLGEAMPQLQNIVIIAELVICFILLYEIHVFLGNLKLLLTAIFGPILAISKLFS